MNNNYLNSMEEEYDAIVIGTGISGGWAAKELCENGLKTLVLERGRMIKHVEDYHTAYLDPWDLPNGGAPSRETRERKSKQHRTGYVTAEAHQHFFVDDIKHPYRSYTISINKIIALEGNTVEISNKKIPIGRNYLKQTKERILNTNEDS